MASASISRFIARGPTTGEDVALKIRRPGIDKLIHADLDILKNLAQLAERRLPFLTPYGPTALAREFERSLLRELDFNVERRTMERCQAQFARDPTAHIPYVVKDYSNARRDRHGVHRRARRERPRRAAASGDRPGGGGDRGAGSCFARSSSSGSFTPTRTRGTYASWPVVSWRRSTTACSASSTGTRERIADLSDRLADPGHRPRSRALDALEIRGEQVDPKALRRDVASWFTPTPSSRSTRSTSVSCSAS